VVCGTLLLNDLSHYAYLVVFKTNIGSSRVFDPALRHYAILASRKSMIREFWRSKEIRGLQFSKIDPRALMTEQYELQGMSK
jgi:hypothetical protein